MIKFNLVCASGHEFQSWFRSGEAFEAQAKDGAVLCPLCQTAQVTKAIMAPAIASRSGATPPELSLQDRSPQDRSQVKAALLDQSDLKTRALVSAFRQRVFESAEDVGMRFAEEARKIHNGLIPERAIHGQASLEDARGLIEDGIAILPVPTLPDEYN
jgi:hypothetical protein